MTDTAVTRQSRGDTVAIWIFMVAGAIIAAASIRGAVARIIEVLPNRDVRVYAEFAGDLVDAPIGPGGTALPVELDSAYLTVPSLPPIGIAVIVLQQLIAAATVVAVVVCLLLLSRGILRGTVFSRRNTALAATAGIVGLLGSAAVPFFGNMAANTAFARISDREFDNVVISMEPFPYILGCFIVALLGTVFVVGDRLQRETEGLV
ncbi:hypothetical protein [Agromyces archimandritae]|uniref:DUF2975 domain-containing protein n=1 Tax=Agromyces archimandritae TaxID=2781962 RepID=A0A975FQV6_9MICO|nr:hypothetical protein [Agromyces archimandritae]QTX05551.1 hypothetical protein G127AT_04880 [Agromyces archimandritae]